MRRGLFLPILVLALICGCSVQIYDLQPIIVGTNTPVPTVVEQKAFVGVTPSPPISRAASPTPPIHLAPTAITSMVAVNIYELVMVDGGSGWAIGRVPNGQDRIVLRTADGGNTWKNVTPSQVVYENAGASFSVTGSFKDANHAWLIFFDATQTNSKQGLHIWFTVDGGITWEESLLPAAGYALQFFEDPKITFLDNNTGWVFARIGRSESREFIGLYTTHDGGRNWNAMVTSSTGNLPSTGHKNGAVFRDTLEGWISAQNTINEPDTVLWHTFDGGNSWYKQQLPAPWGLNIPAGLLSDPAYACSLSVPKFVDIQYQYAWTVLTCSGGDLTEPVAILYWSYDRLSSWKMTGLPSATGALTFYGVQTGWYSIQNPPGADYPFTILFTEDGGDNWRPAANLSWDSVLQFITPAIGFGVATFNNMPALVRTSNSGFAWEQLFPMVVP